jgi:hypothetical protein
MKTKRKSVKSRKTQKQKFGGAEKNKIFRKGNDVIYLKPLLWSRLHGFRRPEFITYEGARTIEIYGYVAFLFIKFSNKWYALASNYNRGQSLIHLLIIVFAEIHSYELPEFKLEDGIITNIGNIIQISKNSPTYKKLIQIKKDIGFVNF